MSLAPLSIICSMVVAAVSSSGTFSAVSTSSSGKASAMASLPSKTAWLYPKSSLGPTMMKPTAVVPSPGAESPSVALVADSVADEHPVRASAATAPTTSRRTLDWVVDMGFLSLFVTAPLH